MYLALVRISVAACAKANAELMMRGLTGHSLGGAVATLAMLRLLAQLPPGVAPAAKCVNFACPAIGNAALAERVQARGWEACFTTFLVPGAQTLNANTHALGGTSCNACFCHAVLLHALP